MDFVLNLFSVAVYIHKFFAHALYLRVYPSQWRGYATLAVIGQFAKRAKFKCRTQFPETRCREKTERSAGRKTICVYCVYILVVDSTTCCVCSPCCGSFCDYSQCACFYSVSSPTGMDLAVETPRYVQFI